MCEMLDSANKIVSEFKKTTKEKFGVDVRISKIVINNYVTRVLGLAKRFDNGTYELHVSGKAYKGHHLKSEFRNTVAHEFAHIADHQIFSGWGHGSSWKKVMAALGEAAYECPPAAKLAEINKTERVTYKYVCGCSTHRVSGQVNSRIKKGGKYVCQKCKKYLKSA